MVTDMEILRSGLDHDPQVGQAAAFDCAPRTLTSAGLRIARSLAPAGRQGRSRGVQRARTELTFDFSTLACRERLPPGSFRRASGLSAKLQQRQTMSASETPGPSSPTSEQRRPLAVDWAAAH